MECSEQMKVILEALPARSLQWLQSENFRMSAVSGQIVPWSIAEHETFSDIWGWISEKKSHHLNLNCSKHDAPYHLGTP